VLKPRGGCAAVPASADLFVRVSSPPAGGTAASVLKRCWAAAHSDPTARARFLEGFAPHRPRLAFQRPSLSSSSAFAKQTPCDWRFFQSLRSRLLATHTSLRLCEADIFRLTLLSAFAKQTSYDWRFPQSLRSRHLPTDAPLSLCEADFLRLAFLSVFAKQTSFD